MTAKCAIVTGASRGLGEEISVGLASLGIFVIGVSRGGAFGPQWQTLIDSARAIHVRGDVADPATGISAVEKSKTIGQVVAVINCAGLGVFKPAGEYSGADVTTLISANLIGLINVCEASIPLLSSIGGGTVVNVMSTAALNIRPSEAVYSAAKWGARAYTDTIRQELRAKGVRVVGVYPGGMNTGFWISSGPAYDSSSFMHPRSVAEKILRNIFDEAGGYTSDLTISRG